MGGLNPQAGRSRPGAPPGSGLEPLYSPVYEPLWDACAATGTVVNHHSGSAVPAMGPEPIDQVVFMLEVTWWAHRALWQLIFGGVLWNLRSETRQRPKVRASTPAPVEPS